MDSGLIRTVPSALAGAATGLGYAHDVMVLLSVSQYIRNLGYSAVPTMPSRKNGTHPHVATK